jgi:hypothetical protein
VDHLKFAQFVALLLMINLSSKRFYDAVLKKEKASLLVGRGVTFGVQVLICI